MRALGTIGDEAPHTPPAPSPSMEPQQVPSLSRSRPDTGGRGASLSPASSVECRARNKGREAPFAFDCQSRRCRRCRCRWAQGREGRLRRRPKGAGGTPLSAVEVTRQVEVERKSERVRGWRAGVQEEPTWCCLVDDGWMDGCWRLQMHLCWLPASGERRACRICLCPCRRCRERALTNLVRCNRPVLVP